MSQLKGKKGRSREKINLFSIKAFSSFKRALSPWSFKAFYSTEAPKGFCSSAKKTKVTFYKTIVRDQKFSHDVLSHQKQILWQARGSNGRSWDGDEGSKESIRQIFASNVTLSFYKWILPLFHGARRLTRSRNSFVGEKVKRHSDFVRKLIKMIEHDDIVINNDSLWKVSQKK